MMTHQNVYINTILFYFQGEEEAVPPVGKGSSGKGLLGKPPAPQYLQTAGRDGGKGFLLRLFLPKQRKGVMQEVLHLCHGEAMLKIFAS